MITKKYGENFAFEMSHNYQQSSLSKFKIKLLKRRMHLGSDCLNSGSLAYSFHSGFIPS